MQQWRAMTTEPREVNKSYSSTPIYARAECLSVFLKLHCNELICECVHSVPARQSRTPWHGVRMSACLDSAVQQASLKHSAVSTIAGQMPAAVRCNDTHAEQSANSSMAGAVYQCRCSRLDELSWDHHTLCSTEYATLKQGKIDVRTVMVPVRPLGKKPLHNTENMVSRQ